MRDDHTQTARGRAPARTTVERRDRDRDYHRLRATVERSAAADATDPSARAVHLQLAELYEAAC